MLNLLNQRKLFLSYVSNFLDLNMLKGCRKQVQCGETLLRTNLKICEILSVAWGNACYTIYCRSRMLLERCLLVSSQQTPWFAGSTNITGFAASARKQTRDGSALRTESLTCTEKPSDLKGLGNLFRTGIGKQDEVFGAEILPLMKQQNEMTLIRLLA